MATPQEEATRAIERAKEEGRVLGLAQARAESGGRSAGLAALGIFSDAAEAAGSRLQASDPDVARAFTKFAKQFREAGEAPQVVSSIPGADAANVPVDSTVSVTFDRKVGNVTADTVNVGASSGGGKKAAEIVYDQDSKTVTLTMDEPFAAGVEYLVSVDGVKNAAGFVEVAPTTFRFTTAAE